MSEDYVLYKEFSKHLIEAEKNNGKLWAAVSTAQAHTDNLIKLQWWFMGIVSSVLVGLVLYLLKG